MRLGAITAPPRGSAPRATAATVGAGLSSGVPLQIMDASPQAPGAPVPVPPGVCSICANEKAQAINAAVRREEVPLSQIAAEYGVSYMSLWRHKGNCILKLKDLNLVDPDHALLNALRRSIKTLKGLSDRLLRNEKFEPERIRSITALMGELRQTIKLLSGLSRERGKNRVVEDVELRRQFDEFKAVVLQELETSPEIRERVVKRIQKLVAP